MPPQQPTTSQQALQQLQSAQSTAQDPNSILKAQQQQLGVNAAQDTVTGLRGAINNTTKLLTQVAPSVMGRTQNSLVTSAQATRQIGNEQAPIVQNLNKQTGDYTQANQDLDRLQQQAAQAASGQYQGQQDKLSYAQNLYNTLYKQEQDAAAKQAAEAAAAEQQREFNASLNAKAAAGNGSSGISDALGAILGGGSSSPAAAKQNPLTQPTLAGGKSQQDAYNAVQALLGTKNQNLINSTVAAIAKSAQKGNTYDKYKIQLLNQLGF